MEIESQKIKNLMYSEYNPDIEYQDGVLLEFNFFNAKEIVLKYGIGNEFGKEEIIMYNEGNILITKKTSYIENHYDLHMYYYCNDWKEIQLLKDFLKNHTNIFSNIMIDIDQYEQDGIIGFYELSISENGLENNFGYLNHLAKNMNVIIDLMFNYNLKITNS